MATIKEVARRAGVSTATVSRVLNKSGYFDETTARKVERAVEALSYRRNVNWERLARNSSQTVCFLLGNRTRMTFMQMELLMACEQVLSDAGYDLIFERVMYREDTPKGRLQLPRIISRQGTVDGVILVGVHYTNLLDALVRIGLPYVLLGTSLFSRSQQITTDAVLYDDISGAYDAMRYLIRLGHRKIAFVGNKSLPGSRRRQEAYIRAAREEGLAQSAYDASWDVSDVECGQLGAAELLRSPEPPTAIFAASDGMAAGVWKELVKRGISIPRQMSLLGFGALTEYSILEPPLTTVSVFQDKLGAELARMLLEKLEHPGLRLESRTFPCRLVENSSCAPPREGSMLEKT
jgi:DNA-binding LacI/PurR family transcriptional regulator